MRKLIPLIGIPLFALGVSAQTTQPVVKPKVQGHGSARVVEKLSRAAVAVTAPDGKRWVSWRMLEGDAADFTPDVKPIELAGDKPHLKFKLPEGATVQKVGIADLDGDGELDYVVKTPDSNVDPYEKYWKKSPGTYTLIALKSDGTTLWTYDMGWSIEQGIWYAPYIVQDLDGDGKAEVALKTGEGDPRDAEGKVTSGPEWLSILDGMTGKEKAKVPWPSRDGFPNYNYYCRNQMGVAYLDGKTPCLLVERGTYNIIKLEAWQFHGGKLQQLWAWHDKEQPGKFAGQGAHCIRVADVDDDGRDEVILGSAVIDDNGTPLWTNGMGHPDHVTVGDLDPARPGLEIHYGYETKQKKNGICMVDAKTGQIIWGIDESTIHVHGQGLCADIDARFPGSECYGGERDLAEKKWLLTAQGKLISNEDLGGLAPRAVLWDADPQRELIRGRAIRKYGRQETLGQFEGKFVAAADVLGDWREEIIVTLPGEMRIYTTNIPAAKRRVTLLRDPIYRLDVAIGSQAYYQIPGMRTALGE